MNVPTLTLQDLIDAEWLNPFALQLLVESWQQGPAPMKEHRITFDFKGCRITLEPTPPDKPFDGATPLVNTTAGRKQPPPPGTQG